ncbi:serine-rich coiled-coil domain-containing protein 2 isoform X1, partial [Tachysurus ichikawai]
SAPVDVTQCVCQQGELQRSEHQDKSTQTPWRAQTVADKERVSAIMWKSDLKCPSLCSETAAVKMSDLLCVSEQTSSI